MSARHLKPLCPPSRRPPNEVMKSAIVLQPRVRQDIQARTDKILRELGNPEPVWSNNSSVKFQCCHSGFVLDSCAVNLPPCLGKSCWLVSLDKSMRPCIKNWSSCWKKTVFTARSWNGI